MVGMVVPGVRVLALALVVLGGCGPPPVRPGEMLTPPETCDAESDGTFEAIELYGAFSDLPLRDGDPVSPQMIGPIPHITLRVAFEGGEGDLSCVRTTFEGDYEAEHILRMIGGVTDSRSDRIRMPAPVEGEFRLEVTARGQTIQRTLVLTSDTTPPPTLQRIQAPTFFAAAEQNELTLILNRETSQGSTVVLEADRPFFASPSRLIDVRYGTSSATVEVRVNEPGPIRFEAWVLGREESPVSVDVEVREAERVDFEITPNDLELDSGWPVRVELRIAEPVAVDLPFGVEGTAISGLINAGSRVGFLDVVRDSFVEMPGTRVLRVTPRDPEYRGEATFTMRPPAPRAPLVGDLAFNEIHANPTEDMNYDGRVDPWDRYVELVNVSGDFIDLSEMTINGARFFSVLMAPHETIIIFAGPVDPGAGELPHCFDLEWGRLYDIGVGALEEELVMDTSVSLELSGRVIASATWDPASLAPGESLQRWQDLLTFFGEVLEPMFMPHSELHPSGDLFSPGLPYAERLP